MLHVISPDEDELPLAVETERVDEAQPRLPGPAARDPQPVREHQTINDRQRHQNGDPASYQNADLGNRVAAKRKVIQPLHAISNTHTADRADDNLALRHGRRAQHVVNTLRRVQSNMDPANPPAPSDRRHAHCGPEQAEQAS
jgi:hypothetical protein